MAYDYRIAFFCKHKQRTLYALYIAWALERLGCTVKHVNPHKVKRFLGRRLADAWVRRSVRRFRPDAIIFFSRDIFPETLAALRGEAKVAAILDDYFPVTDVHTELFKQTDVFFHTQKGQLEDYRAAGVPRPVFVPSGVDPDYHQPGPFAPEFASDVAFIGRAIYPHRLELIHRLAEEPGLDLALYGAGWEDEGLTSRSPSVAVRDFQRVCTSSKIMLGVDKAWELELYFSNRTWFTLGCGGFLITRYVKGLEQVFANHRQLVWFESTDEALELIRFYLQHDEARRRIAQAGREFVHTHYPNERMARSILAVLLEGGEVEPLTDPGVSFDSPEAALAAT